MDTPELYAIVLGSLLVLFLGWQVARVGDVFLRRSLQLIHKNLLQTLIVTRRRGSSDYTVGIGVTIMLLFVGNIVAVCLGVKSLHDMTERVRAIFHVNLIALYIGTRTPILAETALGLTLRQYSVMHRALGWICLTEGLSYALLSLAFEQWTVRSLNFGVRRFAPFAYDDSADRA